MTQPNDDLCPGVTVPYSTRPLMRCCQCRHYQRDATGMEPLMRQSKKDGTWHCPNEAPMGVVSR